MHICSYVCKILPFLECLGIEFWPGIYLIPKKRYEAGNSKIISYYFAIGDIVRKIIIRHKYNIQKCTINSKKYKIMIDSNYQ